MRRPHPMPLPPTLILLVVLAICSAGCGDQASSSYGGEPLATLHGVLVSELAQPLPEAEIVIAWPDWSKGDGESAPFATFARLPVQATLPARFSATLFEPPPATAFASPPAGVRLPGPRYASAIILLARKGKEVTSTGHLALNLALLDPNEAVLDSFDDYLVTYVQGDGYHLVRQDRTVCALSYDEACIAENVSLGFPADLAWPGCVTTTESVKGVDTPLDTEVTWTLKDPSAPMPRPPLCDAPSTR